VWLSLTEIDEVIQLNLLPHRETSRKKKREQYFASVFFAALVGVGLSALAVSWFQAAIRSQNEINAILDAEILTLDRQIKDIKGLESQISALQARKRTVEDVQSDRNQSVHLLSELSRQLPPGVLLVRVSQTDQQVFISGMAQSNEQVSELLRNLAGASAWFTKPELVETVATSLSLPNKEQRPMFNFSVRVLLLRGSDLAALPARVVEPAPLASSVSPAVVREP
jgi:type IV pilus assembly protein PilN